MPFFHGVTKVTVKRIPRFCNDASKIGLGMACTYCRAVGTARICSGIIYSFTRHPPPLFVLKNPPFYVLFTKFSSGIGQSRIAAWDSLGTPPRQSPHPTFARSQNSPSKTRERRAIHGSVKASMRELE
ncbi:Protein of unknown function [Pyronema omphalodes CBS 100304]|uniref:Uncharacterized protein n=1 Tax=Pyronema omphalodes (strain CBS 100304) TaxID=1076935 RepID=U4LHL8_PYROM|nr:Protein of unknown function [Pyronema omphalodes CBS 100304]